MAVIDTGVDYIHQDLAANMWMNTGEIPGNGIDDDGNGYIDDIHGIDVSNHDSDPFDDHGHGTHVSGTIGAVGNNGIGVVGVNWDIRIMACKFLDAGGYGYTDGAVTCLQYIKTMRDGGVNVVATNNSWGCDGSGCFSRALYDAINDQQDILFIAAAGNDSLNLDYGDSYPAKYGLPNAIAVAATDSLDGMTDFSSFGQQWVHVGAPGQRILSTLPEWNAWNITGGMAISPGTSMAAAHVTGLAGLLKAQNPGQDWRMIKNLILSGGDAIFSLENKTISGRRINTYGSASCVNRSLISIMQSPLSSVMTGIPVTLKVLSITCGFPLIPGDCYRVRRRDI